MKMAVLRGVWEPIVGPLSPERRPPIDSSFHENAP